jgi:thioredoxin-like negative regulator of GroEL
VAQILRARADAGDEYATRELADLLAECGDLDEAEQILRGLADAGDEYPARELADLLAQRGDLDGLRARVDVGDQDATRELSGLLIKQGRREEAERLRRFGLNPDGSIAWA